MLTGDRSKRALYLFNPIYNLPGLGGCCRIYWACTVQIVDVRVGVPEGGHRAGLGQRCRGQQEHDGGGDNLQAAAIRSMLRTHSA